MESSKACVNLLFSFESTRSYFQDGERDYVFAEIVGVDYELVPPVPIPNTVVKQLHADNTWLVTAWEDT